MVSHASLLWPAVLCATPAVSISAVPFPTVPLPAVILPAVILPSRLAVPFPTMPFPTVTLPSCALPGPCATAVILIPSSIICLLHTQAVPKKKKENGKKGLAKILTQVLNDCKKAEGLTKLWLEVFSVSSLPRGLLQQGLRHLATAHSDIDCSQPLALNSNFSASTILVPKPAHSIQFCR